MDESKSLETWQVIVRNKHGFSVGSVKLKAAPGDGLLACEKQLQQLRSIMPDSGKHITEACFSRMFPAAYDEVHQGPAPGVGADLTGPADI